MTLMPELKRDLVEAAARLNERRRRLRVRPAVAAAGLAAAAALAAGTFVVARDDDPERAPSARDRGSERIPRPDVHPVRGSHSPRIDFGFAGARYSIVGFRSSASVCTALSRPDTAATAAPSGQACLAERLLRRALAAKPFDTFGGGGGDPTFTSGFARAEVTRMSVTARHPARVVLSEPWRPEPWRGRPIRFFDVLLDTPPGADPGDPSLSRGLRLSARLADGTRVCAPVC